MSKDPAGRFVIVQGVLFSEKNNLINVYGPNDDNPNFFNDLFLTISSLSGLYIMAGDMNCTLDPVKDRSTGSDSSHVKTRKVIQQFMKDLNLLDIWRHLNPTSTAYSCYSSTYRTHSRIDYFLISAELLTKIADCQYHAIVISDHAAG